MSSYLFIIARLVYFVLIMKKVQSGQVIEFYSNSCLVKTNFGDFSCLAIKNVVVGDYVELEIIQDSKQLQGKIRNIKNRSSKLSKFERNKAIADKTFNLFIAKDLDGMMEYLRVQSYLLSNDPNQTFENGLFLG